MNEQQRDEGAVSDFIERFAAELTEAGMPRMPSRVFTCVLASDSGAMTSTELAEALQISPAAVSGAVRYLSQVRIITREREPGSRRERYRVHSDQWYESFTQRGQMLKSFESALQKGSDTLGPGTPAGVRLAETADFFAFLRNELASMMDRWEAHKATRVEPR